MQDTRLRCFIDFNGKRLTFSGVHRTHETLLDWEIVIQIPSSFVAIEFSVNLPGYTNV